MIRILTLNIWQEQGPWERRLELIQRQIQELAPDAVCLQEVREVPGKVANQAETLAQALGMEHIYRAVQEWGGGDEGLAILSRFPIIRHEARELPAWPKRSRRICLGAEIKTPEGLFWLYTTHLAYRPQDGALRELQVMEAERLVASHASDHASVLCGDFNATPDTDEIRFLGGRTSLGGRRVFYQDAFAVCNRGAEGLTWCRDNPYTAQLSWLEQDRRLDYIFVTPCRSSGSGVVEACRIVCNEPDQAGVYCSDHYGLLAEISIAPPTTR